jgi:hypothetical protein
VDRRLSAILAADVVGYSRLMGRDEEGRLSSLSTTWPACTPTNAGEVEQALDCLEDAARLGPLSRDTLEHDSDLDPLRAEDRFQALFEKL